MVYKLFRPERTIEALRLVFEDLDAICRKEDGSYDEEQIQARLRDLERMPWADSIEQIAELAMGLYDRANSCSGEVTDSLFKLGSDRLFGRRADEKSADKRFAIGADPMSADVKVFEAPSSDLHSSKYYTVLITGMELPHVLTKDDELYRAVIKEHRMDPAKYLLLKFYRAPGLEIKRTIETNDLSYARSHIHLGF